MTTHTHQPPLHLFDAFGVEAEYMIVDKETLDVLPVSDRLLTAAHGYLTQQTTRGPLCWSNELVLHVIELKTNGPVPHLSGLHRDFQHGIHDVNRLLDRENAMLLPGGTHPWMNPFTQTRLWPHNDAEIYQAFNRVFDCRGHGWSNLQSIHLNLPFCGDQEFVLLHTAIRLILPLLPALAASSPFLDSTFSGYHDARMETYRHNCRRIPSISGHIIPEPVTSVENYQSTILNPIYADLSPYDPEKILQEEWVNARGAIARFDRNTIEIRVLDVQECPAIDCAILEFTVALLQWLIEKITSNLPRYRDWPVQPLAALFVKAIRNSLDAPIDDPQYLQLFEYPGNDQTTFRHLLRHIIPQLPRLPRDARDQLHFILDHGTLAQRLLQSIGPAPTHDTLQHTARQLARCLQDGIPYRPSNNG
jgi:gamma-glutamyl:cysteine ligase YbdK (ATP-grasp superfamily)